MRVLVEGDSDRAALQVLAARRGLSLDVVVLGGAHAVAPFMRGTPPEGFAGLCDAAEAPLFRRFLADVFVCHEDLEDELIRALGTERVEEVLEADGELERFRVFRNQPYQRERPLERQLRRFLSTTSGRKIRYGALLAEALEPGRVPDPLERLLDHVQRTR